MAGDQRLEDDLEDIGVHAAGAIIAHLVSGHPGNRHRSQKTVQENKGDLRQHFEECWFQWR